MVRTVVATARIPTKFEVISNPEWFAATFLKIQDKSKALIPLQWNPIQRKLMGSLASRNLVLKSRQVGITTAIQAEAFRRAVTSSQAILTLSHDSDSTELLRLMQDRYYDNCWMEGAQPARKYANASLTTYPEYDSTTAIGTAGNLKIGRGSTWTFLHGSEVAFWKDAESIIAGALQGGDPQVILESTPNGASGYFYELCMEALAGRGAWKLHFFPWWEDPTYAIPLEPGEVLTFAEDEMYLIERHNLGADQIKWRRSKQQELKRLFKQEYPEDPVSCFLTSGDSYFGEILEGVFTAPSGATYQPGHVYTMGLDWGQSSDFTFAPVFDRTTNVQVDFLHINHQPWKEMRRRIRNLYTKWHCQVAKAEVNSIGSVNVEELQADGLYIEPFETSNESKGKLMGDYYDRLENGLKLMDWGVQKSEHYSFVATQLPSGVWRLAGKDNSHDDTVIGDALGATARMQPLKARSFGR